MKLPLCLFAVTLAAAPAAQALDDACEPFVAAAEKTAAQPARHSVSQLDANTRAEAILVGGKMYMQMGGRWMKGPPNFSATEKKLNAEMRSGVIELSDCKKLGHETVDGVATTAYTYRMKMPGTTLGSETLAKVFIGGDGLVYAQDSGDGAKVRYRYTGVTAPKVGP